MAGPIDISDLPAPPVTSGPPDISDLPVPPQPAASPTDDMSTSDKVLAGAGKGFVDTAAGVHQIALHIGNHLGLVSDEDLAKNQADVDATKERDAPLMATTPGKIGDAVGMAAPALVVPGAGIAGAAATGAALGAAQPVATGESRTVNAAMGAAGGAAGAGVGKLASGALGGFGGAGGKQAAVDVLKSEGIPLSVAQQTGAKGAQAIERASAMTSDAPAEFAQQQNEAFNRAVLKRIGVNDPGVTAATPDVLGPARARIGGVMNDVADRTNVNVDDQLLGDLANVEHTATRQLPASDVGPIKTNLNDILENAANNGGALDGKFYQKLNSNLGALSKNPAVAPIAGDLQDAVNDALQRSADPTDIAALTTARQQYRVLKQIEPAVDPATGNISIPKLMNSLAAKPNRSQALYGNGDQSLMNLARAAKQVIPDTLGNSGTAERALPAMTALETLGSGEPVKAGIKAGAGVLGLNAAGKAMRNQGAIGNALANGVGPAGQAAAPIIKKAAARAGASLGEQFGVNAPIQ